MARQKTENNDVKIEVISQNFVHKWNISKKYLKVIVELFHKFSEEGWQFDTMPFPNVSPFNFVEDSDDIVENIQTTGIDKFVNYTILLKRLTNRNNPNQCLYELIQYLSDFEEYLIDNRNLIIKKGISFDRFYGSSWLEFILSPLYNFRGPNLVKSPNENVFSYYFSYFPAEKIWNLPDDKLPHIHNHSTYLNSPFYPQSERSLFPEIKKRDEIKIEGDRERLLDYKIQVLKKIVDSSIFENTLEYAIDILTHFLSVEKVQYYLSMDKIFMNCTINDSEIMKNKQRIHSGGISDVIFLCAHIEKEKTIETYDSTVKLINGIYTDQDFFKLYHGDFYFSHIFSESKVDEYNIDMILDHFNEKLKQENEYWIQLNHQINQMFNKMFSSKSSKHDIQSEEDFRYSKDFSSVNWKGIHFSFSGFQNEIMVLLYDAYKQKTPNLHQNYILSEVGSKSKRLVYIFKNHPAWGKLIIKGDKKGTFRLNI
jgi:hypothetical protein